MAYSRKSTGAGLAIGAGFGTALGVALHNIGVWLPIGVALGLLFPVLFGGEANTCDPKDDKQISDR
jgi:hypothetical protein